MPLEMERKKFVLYVLSCVDDKTLSPVQAQKLFFLIDEKLSNQLGNKYFDFKSYDYGPFDKTVYDELDALQSDGEIKIESSGFIRNYILNCEKEIKLNEVNNSIEQGIKTLCKFVKECSFKELLTAIYDEYPQMAVNTVFKGWERRFV